MRVRDETRRRARTAQLLYAWEMQDRPPLAQTATGLLAHHPLCRRAIETAETWAADITGDIDVIDRELGEAVEHWRPERIGAIERSILRLALWELREGQTPPKVVISEAVRLAHWFAGGSAPAFVNGVVDAVARRAGHL